MCLSFSGNAMTYCHLDTLIAIFFQPDKEIACTQGSIKLEETELKRNNGKHNWKKS